ncbi:protein PLANT CADMIUM RESISTANCE 10-like [Cucurbita pepo subsp. pepo]|uniref:protein PLANT CADMIUM RESISTANCE 10-like n=1 Tax=Cucurbita pepo subsp. pepo TaxID=3664 RepID=UPI000C9D9E0D|nr:protein PLANT CADMIUM RESISTANCE 10-like [Cucurbita pepo subsp. pepo]XP_023540977.1 protein PLANT CADMIUM RESISTANCE 10-like [Cucurbita pepo subsp. pepo]XP_023540978.1 protein PLANT CADMIUM RESISTANCE 10-like [Cucurbita pepo subsp. pepo]
MDGGISYVPPAYVPLGQSDPEAEIISRDEGSHSPPNELKDGLSQWSSGICACCDDMQSCFVGLFCPCFLFGKNAELLGSRTMFGSCATHFILWALTNTVCCLLTDGLFLNLPGCVLACYACGYRKALRSKYNLPEAPCGDFVTHFFCHFCAICQEYREIRERARGSGPHDLSLAVVTPPTTQTMDSNPEK